MLNMHVLSSQLRLLGKELMAYLSTIRSSPLFFNKKLQREKKENMNLLNVF